MTGAERVRECPLPLRAPHDPIDFVGPRIVLDGAQQPVVIIRVVETQGSGVRTVETLFLRLRDVRDAVVPDVFEPADGLHPAFPSFRDDRL